MSLSSAIRKHHIYLMLTNHDMSVDVHVSPFWITRL
jgi:hypothetical protein